MTPQQLVGIGVRLFALWLGLLSIGYFFSAVLAASRADAGSVVGIMGAGCLLIGLVLWFMPMLVAHKLLPRTQHDNRLSFRAHELARAGCSLLGLWLLAKALPSLVWFLLRALLVAESGSAFSALTQDAKLDVGVALFEAVFAIVLVLKSAAFARLAAPAQVSPAGAAEGIEPTPPAEPGPPTNTTPP